jgi:hypothetical protein
MINHRIDTHDADDLVQGFIQERILQGNLIDQFDPKRGQFGGLLIKSLDNYVKNQRRRRTADKRRAERAASLDEDDYRNYPATTKTTDRLLQAGWARELLSMILVRMEAECLLSERNDLWELFYGRIVAPILDGTQSIDYDDVVPWHSFSSLSRAHNALVTAKRMFRRVMCTVLRELGTEDDDVESEILELRRCAASAELACALPLAMQEW